MAQKLIRNPSLRNHEVAAAIQKNIVLLNLFQDLLKKDAANLVSMTRTRLPRRHKCLLSMTIPVAMQQTLNG
ncbi:hypothetical protein [Rickettsia endosymbiont of Orchestes rusci]|uniref:hypothetical protein n=1 Tax=Rickettsia endosymbiont of Orchestes rusci TaxID=3066250 RepID=UPI00313E388D